MASNACRIGSSVAYEFCLHDLCDLCESIAHFCEFIGQIGDVLFETIDLSLERFNWIDSGVAVRFAIALSKVAITITLAF